MSDPGNSALVGILGGTFDPIHRGHTQTAVTLQQALGFDQLRLIPSAIPPHRQSTQASAEQRLAMVKLAAAECTDVVVDEREIIREGVSYSVDTLKSLRHELGDEVSLCLIMGMDAFLLLDSWHEWQQLADLTHIVVMNRPGFEAPADGVMARFLHAREAEDAQALRDQPYGRVWVQQVPPADISATAIRAAVQAGSNPEAMLAPPVWRYIQTNKLYGYDQTAS